MWWPHLLQRLAWARLLPLSRSSPRRMGMSTGMSMNMGMGMGMNMGMGMGMGSQCQSRVAQVTSLQLLTVLKTVLADMRG